MAFFLYHTHGNSFFYIHMMIHLGQSLEKGTSTNRQKELHLLNHNEDGNSFKVKDITESLPSISKSESRARYLKQKPLYF